MAQKFVTVVDGHPAIEIGRMRTNISILVEAPTGQYTDSGPEVAFTTFLKAKAAIDSVRGTDVIRGGQTTTQLYLVVAMWFQPGILPNMHVRNEDNGNEYIIQSVENVRERDWVLLLNCIGLGLNT